MEQVVIEKELTLAKVSVQLASVQWGEERYRPRHAGYQICQRLSDDHSPLRIGNFSAPEAFPRVRSVAFLPPGFPIQLQPVDRPFRVLNCIFDQAFFEATTAIEPAFWEQHFSELVSIKDRRLETLMQEIYAELLQPGFAFEIVIEAACNMIVVEMARFGQRLEMSSGQSGAGLGLAPWQLRRINERIEASLEIGYPSLNELAQICGISQSHLMRTFKVSTGWQIHKYIAEERMRAAKLMLAKDQLSAKEISAKLGFSSPAYFATAFQRMTGMTPTEYRTQARASGVDTI